MSASLRAQDALHDLEAVPRSADPCDIVVRCRACLRTLATILASGKIYAVGNLVGRESASIVVAPGPDQSCRPHRVTPPGLPVSGCRSCAARVIWAQIAKSGKMCPFDAAAVPGGDYALERRGDVVTASAIERDAAASLGYVFHFTTCPNAAAHSRTRKESR